MSAYCGETPGKKLARCCIAEVATKSFLAMYGVAPQAVVGLAGHSAADARVWLASGAESIVLCDTNTDAIADSKRSIAESGLNQDRVVLIRGPVSAGIEAAAEYFKIDVLSLDLMGMHTDDVWVMMAEGVRGMRTYAVILYTYLAARERGDAGYVKEMRSSGVDIQVAGDWRTRGVFARSADAVSCAGRRLMFLGEEQYVSNRSPMRTAAYLVINGNEPGRISMVRARLDAAEKAWGRRSRMWQTRKAGKLKSYHVRDCALSMLVRWERSPGVDLPHDMSPTQWVSNMLVVKHSTVVAWRAGLTAGRYDGIESVQAERRRSSWLRHGARHRTRQPEPSNP